IASGLVKLLFKSDIAACRSFSPNELMICSVVGVADGDGEGDAAFDAEGDGVGLSPKRSIINKNEMAVTTARFHIALIGSWSPPSEQYRAGNGSRRSECAMPPHKRAGARQQLSIRARSTPEPARPTLRLGFSPFLFRREKPEYPRV